MPQQRPRVIIVGAGFGGLEAAKALSRVAVDVIVVDRQNHHCFQPLLYQVATAALSPAEIAWPIRHMLRQQPNATVFMAEVRAVDLAAQFVETNAGPMPYDYLVIATGATHSYFGMTIGPSLHPGSSVSKTRPAFAEAFCWHSSKPSLPAMMPSGSVC